MKKTNILLYIGILMLGVSSCKKYLDINSNPNDATSATAELILPQALTATASVLNGYNSYGAQLVGYSANAGGYGGFGTAITYRFGSSDFQGLWSSTFDNLEDYQTILNYTDGLPEYGYFNAAARIMKAYDYQLLIDAYNDVPYTDALKGANALTPKYDNGSVLYDSLAQELDKAMQTIEETGNAVGVKNLGSSDILFHANMNSWKKFANTIKLRLIVRSNGKATITNKTFNSIGFLDDDALVNPGYVRDNNRQNPAWSSWAFSNTLSAGNKAWMPNKFVFAFYNGQKLEDPYRGEAIYYQWPSTPTNQLGHEGNDVIASPPGSFWYSGTDRTSDPGKSPGILKGPNAGYPVMLAAESYFLQAEASVNGILTDGDAKDLFEQGITASFYYLYLKPDNTLAGDPAADAASYIDDNAASPLVNFDLATTNESKLEAIITQKYIALNFINSHEAWNEYRRTGYPKVNTAAGASAIETFASPKSESTRPDKLPSRILYPSSEGSYNTANVPKDISPFTSLIFWAK